MLFSPGAVYRDGHLKLLLDTLCSKYNLTYRLVTPTDNNYGTLDPVTGRFNGVVGMVERGEVDIGAGDFTIMEQRQEVVDYSDYTGVEAYSIMMKTPSPHFSKTDTIIAPFSPLVSWS